MLRFPRPFDGFMTRIVKLLTILWAGINKAGFGSRWLRNIYRSGSGRLIQLQIFDLTGWVQNVFLTLLTFSFSRSAIRENRVRTFTWKIQDSSFILGKIKKQSLNSVDYNRIIKKKNTDHSTGCRNPPPLSSSTLSEGRSHLKQEITPLPPLG